MQILCLNLSLASVLILVYGDFGGDPSFRLRKHLKHAQLRISLVNNHAALPIRIM